MNLSNIQQKIVNTEGNIIVSASAGTGKTHTMVAKIESDIERNKTHKVIAAITFTIKAANEIRNRIKCDAHGSFIGTNNSFVIEEIVSPFIRDVYGEKYNINITTDYSIKKDTFEECLEHLKNEHSICSYTDSKQNFVFELALTIVKESYACRRYLKAKYFKIYVDEYQDCDKTMHDFFMYICKQLKIEFFIVGDEKQSIYIWRGASPEAFRSILKMKDFKPIQMRENHRSCKQIQNYSNLLHPDTRDLFEKIDDISNVILLSSTIDNLTLDISQYIDTENSCAFLRFSNDDAKKGARMLSGLGVEFTYVPKTPINDISTDVAWLYLSIAQYFIVEKYSIYDFMNDIPEQSIGDRKIKQYMKNSLDKIELALRQGDEESVIENVQKIASYLNYSTDESHIRKMIMTILNKEFHSAFQLAELKHVSITYHSSKGLEYDQVIVIANDFPLSKEESVYGHYVAVTRAKRRLIIVKLLGEKEWNIKSYCMNLQKMFSAKGLNIDDVVTVI